MKPHWPGAGSAHVFRWSCPSQQRPRIFLTHGRRCSAQYLAKYLLAGMFVGVTRCSDARAQHSWLWRSAKHNACSTWTPTSKKHLPISIRWLLSETECCKRCECTAPEDIRHAERPGRGIYTGKIHLAVSCCAIGPRCTAIRCFNMVRPRVWFGRKGWRGC